jgi:glyoxylase I family protein
MSRIEHFAIYAADAPKLRNFYEEAFGMRTVVESGGNPPGYFLVDDTGFAIEIIGRPSDQPGADQRWVCHLAFWVDDFAEACHALQARGITFEQDTFVDNDTIRTAFFNDPEGNRCQIVWRGKALGA